MDPEYLSDGVLFESAKSQKKAFLTDPKSALEDLVNWRRQLEKELSLLDPTDLSARINRFIANCKRIVDNCIKGLPQGSSLFPGKEARKKAVSPVSSCLLQISDLQEIEWNLLTALSEMEQSIPPILQKAESLFASLLPSRSAAKGLPIEAEVKNEILQAEALVDRIQKIASDTRENKARLVDLHERFFCGFSTELSRAADLENAGEEASPALVLRLCGEAGQFLSSLL